MLAEYKGYIIDFKNHIMIKSGTILNFNDRLAQKLLNQYRKESKKCSIVC